VQTPLSDNPGLSDPPLAHPQSVRPPKAAVYVTNITY